MSAHENEEKMILDVNNLHASVEGSPILKGLNL